MKRILILAIALVAAKASAQMDVNGTPLYRGEGRLVTLRLVPGDKSATLYLAGRPAAKTVGVKLVSIEGEATEPITFEAKDSGYVLTPFPLKASVLKVRARVGGKEETLKLKLKP